MSNTIESSWPCIEGSDFPCYATVTTKPYSTHSARSHTRRHDRHISTFPNGSAARPSHHSRSFSDIIFHSIFGTTHSPEDRRNIELSLSKTIYEETPPATETAVDTSLAITATESTCSPAFVIKNLVTDTTVQPCLRRRSCRHQTHACPRCGVSLITQSSRKGM